MVREIVRVPEITSVPNAPDYIEGVINLRGRIIPVVDLRKRFGEKNFEPDKKNRIVVVEMETRRIGLLVNSASEVLRIPPSDIEEPHNVFKEGELNYITGVGKLKGRLVILLDLNRILQRGELQRLEDVAESAAAVPWVAPNEISRPDQDHYRGTNVHTTLTTQVPLTEPELKLLQTLVYQECGMYFDKRRTHFLRDRLQRRLKACQIDSFYSYYRLLTSREGKKELTALLENLTVNETSFFRIRPQLDLFQKVVLEEILKRKQERRDWSLRIWSAGCSTGQEPYTLAIMVCDTLAYYYCAIRSPSTCRPQAADPASVEGGNHRFGHQLFRAAHRSAGRVQRKSNGYRGLHHAPPLFR